MYSTSLIRNANFDQILSKCHIDISLSSVHLRLCVLFLLLITKTQNNTLSRTIEILGKFRLFSKTHEQVASRKKKASEVGATMFFTSI